MTEESAAKATPPAAPAPAAAAPAAPELKPVPAEAKGDKNADRNIDMILDIPLKLTVELGRTKMLVSELLNLGQGSVIELNKLAGEPMEILVNDKLIARGEAVVVNEKFGVRLTDIISPQERVEQLK
jgi:flagellar motor switch protein FliN/FliY